MKNSFATFASRTRRTLAGSLASVPLLCAALTAACGGDSGGTVAPAARSLTGNWGSPHYSYASFALTETNGNVTGHGWYLRGFPVSVQGTLDGQNVALTLTRRAPRPTIAITFRGVWSDNALVGDIGVDGESSSGLLTRVSLARVDTVAESIGNVTFSNNFGAARNSNAVFIANETGLSIYPASGSIDDLFLTTSFAKFASRKLLPGTYSVGPSGIFQGAAYGFPALSGTVTIERVYSKLISGSFTMKAEYQGAPFDATGTFSASCPYDDLAPDGLRCGPPG